MRRVLVTIAAAGLLVLCAPAAANAAAPGRIFVIDLPGTSLEDWTRAGATSLLQLIDEGSVGLLSAKAPPPARNRANPCFSRGEPALATLLAGTRTARLTPLMRDTLDSAVRSFTTQGAYVRDTSIPGTSRRVDYPELQRRLIRNKYEVTLAGIEDTQAADCVPSGRAGWIDVSLRRADRLIRFLRGAITPADSIVVISSVPPIERERKRNYLTAAVAWGPSFARGTLLTSATTRRAGVVSLVDVATTLLRVSGVPKTRVGVGQAWRSSEGSLAGLQRDDAAYEHAAETRSPVLRVYVWAAVLLTLLSALMVLGGRGRASGSRLPRRVRDVIAIGAAAICAAPIALLVEPLLHLRSPGGTLLLSGLAAVLLAGLATLAVGPRRAVPLLAGITVVFVAADLASGGSLASRSVLSYSIAEGARFYGIGNELLGVLVASALVWAASALDSIRPPSAPVLAILIAIVVLAAAPQIGAKFGSVFVAVPAFGIVASRALGRPLDRRTLLGIAIATVFAAGVATAADFLSSPETRSHVASVAASGTGGGVLGRKISAALKLIAASYWTAAIVVCGGSVALVAWRRPSLTARATWGRPNLRTALAAAAVAGVAAVAFNDAGVVAAALITMISSAAFFHVLLVEHAVPPRDETIERLKEFSR